MYMVDEADKIMFFNANFLAFAVFVFLAVVILAIQKDLICDILKGKISPLNDAMNAENANEGKYSHHSEISIMYRGIDEYEVARNTVEKILFVRSL